MATACFAEHRLAVTPESSPASVPLQGSDLQTKSKSGGGTRQQAGEDYPEESTERDRAQAALADGLRSVAQSVDRAREDLGKPRGANISDLIQIAGILVAMVAALASAYWSSRTAHRLADKGEKDNRRQFCLHLQSQFDSPQMFELRFNAWKQLSRGNFKGIVDVGTLHSSPHWTYEVSAVIHFFESLGSYCKEGLIDPVLAAQLFGRPYRLWESGLLNQLTTKGNLDPSHEWLERVRLFGRYL